MTERHITLPRHSLRLRLIQMILVRTRDRDRAQRSRYEWRAEADGTYTLRLIGLLHGLIGLVIVVR